MKYKKLKDCLELFRGSSPRPIEKYIVKNGIGINWIKIGDASTNSKYIYKSKEKIIPEGIMRSRFVEKGDLLLSNSMSFGRPYILETSGCIHDGWLVLKNYDKYFIKEYLYYVLSSNYVIKQYKNLASGSSVLNLNKDLVGKVIVPIPNKMEQKNIVDILNNIDELIDKLRNVIEKKSKIKFGLISKYFGETKNKIKIGNLIEVKCGYSFSSNDFVNSGIPVIRITNILNDKIQLEKDQVYINKEVPINFHINKNDILIAMSGATSGKIGIYNSDKISYLNQRVGKFIILDESKLDLYYLYYLLHSFQYHQNLLPILTAGAQPNISAKDLENMCFSINENINEQIKIGQNLKIIDQEIEILNKKMNKFEKIKEGIMEDLLTGKVNLNYEKYKYIRS